ncbi:MAG: tRNA (adenosine(37)-N6)-threonylcarbamoyltransferase complex ATPase subunit type 1 TsaE [Chloroflexi bacterium RBG_16_57_8]|nr:MAG: tRNA (adenosine(37)-N6)-threonylcarbamoyltransferase complex ATPase subunit type 1 TsaE [Chloroflexi bacterium RBG_16_57_8]
MAFEIVTHSPAETQELGRRIGELARPGDAMLLTGELGAGKTCLTQGVAWGLGIEEYALSPTFVIMREMHGRLPLYHMDLYRLDHIEETQDLGLDDYFYGDGVCVVEWAEKAMTLMPPEHLLIEIEYVSDAERRLRLKPKGRRYEELMTQMGKTHKADG